MKTKKYWILGVAVGFCCAAILSVTSLAISFAEQEQLKYFGISTLHGLKGIRVETMLSTSEESKQHSLGSLTKSNLQTQVELSLRKAGIRVLDRYDPDISAILSVTVLVLTSSQDVPLYAAIVTSEACQDVELVRNHKIRTSVRTWPMGHNRETQILLLGGLSRMEQGIKDSVASQVS